MSAPFNYGEYGLCYEIQFKNDTHIELAMHTSLRLKHPPKDEKFESFMNKVLAPVQVTEEV